jgi:hypothetical protein
VHLAKKSGYKEETNSPEAHRLNLRIKPAWNTSILTRLLEREQAGCYSTPGPGMMALFFMIEK